MSVVGGGWSAATGSVRGSTHERDGRPNQDAVRAVAAEGPVPGLVAAVCDGHGGSRYVRSDVGARLGVEEACRAGLNALEQLRSGADEGAIAAHLSGPMATSLVERWRSRVLDHVGRQPFSAEERRIVGDRSDGEPFVSYGCTLVLGVFAADWVGLLQIGDGDVTVRSGGRSTTPVPGDDRLVGGETTSLCLPTAVADARVAVLVSQLPDLVVLTSDGYANSFASPNWREEVGADVEEQVRRLGIRGVATALPAWLAESAVAGGDDVSMALVHRDPSGAGGTVASGGTSASRPAAAAAATVVGAGGTVRAEPPEPTRQRVASAAAPAPTVATGPGRGRTGAVVAAVLVGLVLGAVGGWFAAGASGDDTDSSTTSSSTSTSTTVTTATPATTTTLPLLDPSQQIVVATGAGADAVIALPTLLQPPRLLGWVEQSERPLLPPGWRLEGEVLRPPRSSAGVIQALAVVTTGDSVWVLAPDARTLTQYRASDGQVVAAGRIGDEPDDAEDGTGNQGGAGQGGEVPSAPTTSRAGG